MSLPSSPETIQLAEKNGLLSLTLNRPEKLNALTQEMYTALNSGLDYASSSERIRAVIIAANGDDFSAGNDMRDFMALATSDEDLDCKDLPVVQFIYRIVNFAKPLICAVQGQAVGIGLTLTLHADFVFMAPTAVLSAPFVKLGLVPEAASSLLLPQRIGHLRAAEILLAGKPINAEVALEWGLANQIVPVSDLSDAALACAESLASKPAQAMRMSKQLMQSDKKAVLAHMDAELRIFFERLQSADARAAFAAFLSK